MTGLAVMLQRIRFWLTGPSVTNRALHILGESNLMPSRILKDADKDGYGTVNVYFFKPMADSYALLIIDEVEGTYLALDRDGDKDSTTRVLNGDAELRLWVDKVSDWFTHNSPIIYPNEQDEL
jgi:hypothetical protein